MPSIELAPYRPEMATEVALMLARAFASNPLHLAAFGDSVLTKNEVFFRTVLRLLKGPKFVATDGSQILGLIHWVHSSECQVSGVEKGRLLPTMVANLGVGASLRVLSWLSTWAKHDPLESHVHLGPIGVTPESQGHYIGSRLMMRYCAALGETGESGYLETDRLENVAFYRRFGFETTQEVPVIGVTNYFMSRPVVPASPAHGS